MAYLTLDLSTTCSGWALFTDQHDVISFGKIMPPKHTAKNPVTTNDRTYYMYNHIHKIVKMNPDITKMVWEDQFSGRNGQVGLILSRVRGALIPIFMYHNIEIIEKGYANNTIKKYVGGHGRATKEEVAEGVRIVYKEDALVQSIGPVIEKTKTADRDMKNDDIYDALAIGICYKMKLWEEENER